MSFDVIIANMLVKSLNTLTFFCKPNKNKVTYISYRSNNLPYGMEEISKQLKKRFPNLKETFLTLKFKNSFLDKLQYAFELLKQVYHIKTSSVVFIDGNNFVISNINKKNTTVIQLWHASGAIKKFGMDYKRKYPIKNYDYVITSSSKNKSIMASAFNMKEELILPLGFADVDILVKDEIINQYKEEMYKQFPFLKDKKIVLYAPTFRGNVYEKDYLKVNLTYLKEQLGEEYILIYKMHPILEDIKLEQGQDIYNMNDIYIYKLFSITDILVSDYSSIIYDFSLLEKPVVLYAPDIDNYSIERGFYIDYNSFSPYSIATSENSLIKAIKSSESMSYEDRTYFKREFFNYTDGNSASRIAEFTLEILKNSKFNKK